MRMSCLDFRAAQRDTVHTSCPCPHPREHTPITSKEFERVKKRQEGGRERSVIPRNLKKKKEKKKCMKRLMEKGPLLPIV